MLLHWLVCAALAPALAVEAGPPPENPLAAPAIAEAVEALAATVDREYFDPVVASRVAASLRASLASNAYADAATPRNLAERLTRDMLAWTHDKHLAVSAVPPDPQGPGTPPDQDRATQGHRTNWGIQRVEILPDNVGYLHMTGFYRPDEAGEALSTAMRFVRNADSLILDLRANLGGSPDMVALVSSYLLDQPGLPLFEIIARSQSRQSYATAAASLPGSDGRRPLYVLTSSATFSAGEGLAFLLKERKRAVIIGETTAGAANPGRSYPLTELLTATVPNGQVRGAVSGGNWEGAGVAPDVGVPAADALRVAQERARRSLLGRRLEASGAWQDLLDERLTLLKAAPSPEAPPVLP